MAEEKKPHTVDIEEPNIEKDVPFENSLKGQQKQTIGRAKEIGAKDNRAFWLTCGCVAALAIFAFIDALSERDILADSKMLESFFDIIKYVITTSLGFFFATTISKKE